MALMSADLPQPSLVSNGTTQAALTVPTSIALAVCLVLYGLRIRNRRLSPLEWTDGMTGAALALAVITSVFTAIGCYYGVGRHTGSVDATKSFRARHYAFLAQLTTAWSTCIAKCSISWIIYRARQNIIWRNICGSIAFVQIGCAVAITVVQAVQCQPIAPLPDSDITYSCRSALNTQNAAYVVLGFVVLTDTLLSLTPITFVRGANRPLHELIFLGCLVGVGIFVTTTSIANIVYIHNYRNTRDPLRDMVAPMTWMQVGQNLSIIISLAICLNSLWEDMLQRFGLICKVRRSSSSCRRLNHLEDGPQMLKSLKTTIQWGAGSESTVSSPSITKTTEVVHSTEELKESVYGSPARRPSWQ